MQKTIRSLFLLSSSIIFFTIPSWGNSWKVVSACDYNKSELTLKFEELIRPNHAIELGQTLNQCPELKDLKILLNSPGGSLSETRKIKDILDSAKSRGVVVTTQVNNGDECDSNCVPLFAQGNIRKAGAVAAFMLHGVSTPIISNIPEKASTEEMLAMIRDGASEAWLQKLIEMQVFSIPAMFWMSGAELYKDNSGLVTELLPRFEKFAPYDKTYRAL
ncbi:hypothetical protein BDW_07865 [Bdellovibrio bacteriovorus W]|nr:hypothetical protein BDW_07865 [Bdellovibrio bacteriovorus W]